MNMKYITKQITGIIRYSNVLIPYESHKSINNNVKVITCFALSTNKNMNNNVYVLF